MQLTQLLHCRCIRFIILRWTRSRYALQKRHIQRHRYPEHKTKLRRVRFPYSTGALFVRLYTQSGLFIPLLRGKSVISCVCRFAGVDFLVSRGHWYPRSLHQPLLSHEQERMASCHRKSESTRESNLAEPISHFHHYTHNACLVHLTCMLLNMRGNRSTWRKSGFCI